MLPGLDISSFASTAGPWAAILLVALIIFAESGLLIGFFLPGDSILFTVGFLIESGHLPINIGIALIFFFIAAAAGDSVGYLFGNKVGHRIFNRKDSLLFRRENIEKAQEFYEKFGGKAIILSRFIPVVRTFAPIVAGIGKMQYRFFIIYNLIGAALWASGITLVGFFLGSILTKLGFKIDEVIYPIIAIILVLSVAPPLFHVFKDKEQRKRFGHAVKHHVKKTFKKK